MILLLCLAFGLQDPAPSAKEALAAFKKAYKSPDAAQRAEAVDALGKVHHPKTLKPLLQVLLTDQPEIRIKAAESLSKWTKYSDRAAAVLRAALKPNDKLVEVHTALVKALGDLKELSALRDINARLDHVEVDVSIAAIEAAGKLASPLSVERLVSILERIENLRNQPPRIGGGGIDATRSAPELQAKRRAQYPLLVSTIATLTGRKFKDGAEVLAWWKDNKRKYRGR